MTVLPLAQNVSMEKGGEIHQDNFKSVIMTFCYGITNCYGITSVQGKHEINQPKGFLI